MPETDTAESQIIPVYFPGTDKSLIQQAENALPGYPRNFILLESIKAGIKSVVKKFKDKPAPTSFTDQVKQIVGRMLDQDITTETVKDALLFANPLMAQDESAVPALSNISKVLERLAERGTLVPQTSDGRKKIYRLPKATKKRKVS